MKRMYYADCTGNAKNNKYSHKIDVVDAASFIECVSHDYVCAKFSNYRRSNANFIQSNCAGFDIDNEFSDNPDNWITAEKIAQEFEPLTYAIHYSRNHMKCKGSQSARPRFHIIFATDTITSAAEHKQLKYYEVVYILFHTGMRISEFCGLTIKDVDLENRIVNIEHQLQRLSDMTLVIEPTKTSAGTRKIPVTEDVAKCFQAIIEDREKPKVEKVVDGYTGFLFLDDKGLPLVAMHWEHRFNHMVKRYNDIYRVQMPNITPHVCRHTYCSNMAKSGMNPKTLQYLMGHSDIGVTLNTYTHLGLEDVEDELKRLEDLQNARKELERTQGEKPVSQKMFKAI